MALATMADREIHVDEEAFMTGFDEWDAELAKVLATVARSSARASGSRPGIS